ncbi:MAG: GTP-dependent dephospho-CoA kinase family protein [Halobaculum sp.]
MSGSVLLELPASLRSAFKTPLGAVYTDPEELLAEGGEPVIAVGDVVTYHLRTAGHDPAVAVLDGKTKRDDVSEEVEAVLSDRAARVPVENPQATLTEELLSALRSAVDDESSVVLHVEGEEDLAALPAILVAPVGASVVYGQPDEGMVLVSVTEDAKAEARALLERMDGDSERALEILDG